MGSSLNNLYEFGRFRLDPGQGTVWLGAEVVPLSPKAVELLALLVERRGEIVSKQEIFDKVWANTFVEDGVLTQNIYTLRNALGRDADGRQFIETVPRRGYRFAGDVVRAAKTEFDAPGSDTEAPLEESAPDRPGSRNALIRAGLFTGGIILAVGVLWFGVYELFLRPKPAARSAPIEQVRLERLTDTGDVLFPTISPNGEMFAFVRSGENEQSVWVQQTATGSSVQTLPPSKKGYASLAFSPDGRYLFFRENSDGGSIFQVPTLGGPPRRVTENSWSDIALSPDGKQLAFIRHDPSRRSDALIVCGVDGGTEKEVISRTLPDSLTASPAWSPDGTKIAIGTESDEDSGVRLESIDIATGKAEAFQAPKWRVVSTILWMPDGKHLMVSARDAKELVSQLWMLGSPDGEVLRLTNDLENYFWISRTADGKKIVTRQQHITAHLWVVPDGDLGKAKRLTNGGRNLDGYVGLTWTTDGRILFSQRTARVTDLYTIEPSGGNPVPLTTNLGGYNTFPSVARDGSIAFTSNADGSSQIWRMNADGRERKQLTLTDEKRGSSQWPVFSPDGAVVFFMKRNDTANIWKISSAGGEPTVALHVEGGAADGPLSLSPDGKWIAYRELNDRPASASAEDRTQRVGVARLDGSEKAKFFDLPLRRPITQWMTAESFDYLSGTFNSSRIVRQPLGGGEGQQIINFPDRVFNFAWSRDGKMLAVSRGSLQGDAILINLP
jgi:Tol biopolymer transport system component/DNA-binding winged helix-turn-helix (wHTH) protein